MNVCPVVLVDVIIWSSSSVRGLAFLFLNICVASIFHCQRFHLNYFRGGCVTTVAAPRSHPITRAPVVYQNSVVPEWSEGLAGSPDVVSSPKTKR